MSKKHDWKILKGIGVVVFIALPVLFVLAVTPLFVPKGAEMKYRDFYEEEQDFDVLFLGSSRMGTGVSPMELWSRYGIASFNLAEDGTRIQDSYYVLKNALQYTSPKLVVMEIQGAGVSRSDGTGKPPEMQFNAMPLSIVKCEAAMDLYPTFGERAEFLFPFLTYHSRWSELAARDFNIDYYRPDKGAISADGVGSPEEEEEKKKEEKADDGEEEREPIGDISGEYLGKIAALCSGSSIPILFVQMPFPAEKADEELAEAVSVFAADAGADYLNCFQEKGLMDVHNAAGADKTEDTDKAENADSVINVRTDFTESMSVLNASGMKKFSAYLGEYLISHYELPDRREDAAYGKWHEDYKNYIDYKASWMKDMRAAWNIESYLMRLSDTDFDICLYFSGDCTYLQEESYWELLHNISQYQDLEKLEEAASGRKDYFLFVDNGNRSIRESVGGAAIEDAEASYGTVEYGTGQDGIPYLYIGKDKTDYLEGWEGVPIFQAVVIDRESGKTVEIFSSVKDTD